MTANCKLDQYGCWNDGKCRATIDCENKLITNVDRCVCCGAIIPEGQMVCPNCLVTVKEG